MTLPHMAPRALSAASLRAGVRNIRMEIFGGAPFAPLVLTITVHGIPIKYSLEAVIAV